MNRLAALDRVAVENEGVDALVVDTPTESILFISPDQTFDSAVRAVEKLFPYATVDEVTAVVRKNLPNAVRLDALARLDAVTPVGGYAYDAAGVMPFCWQSAVVAVVAGVMMLAGFYSISQGRDQKNVHYEYVRVDRDGAPVVPTVAAPPAPHSPRDGFTAR